MRDYIFGGKVFDKDEEPVVNEKGEYLQEQLFCGSEANLTNTYVVKVSRAQLENRYSRFGGIPRHLFAKKSNAEFAKKELDRIVNAGAENVFMYRQILDGIGAYDVRSSEGPQLSHRVLQYIVSPIDFQVAAIRFVSTYAAERIFSFTSLQNAMQAVAQFVHVMAGKGIFEVERGKQFEKYCFESSNGLCAERSYVAHRLFTNGALLPAPEATFIDVPACEHPVELTDVNILDSKVRTLFAKYDLEKKPVLLSCKKNQKTIDGVGLNPLMLYQVTVATSHSFKIRALIDALAYQTADVQRAHEERAKEARKRERAHARKARKARAEEAALKEKEEKEKEAKEKAAKENLLTRMKRKLRPRDQVKEQAEADKLLRDEKDKQQKEEEKEKEEEEADSKKPVPVYLIVVVPIDVFPHFKLVESNFITSERKGAGSAAQIAEEKEFLNRLNVYKVCFPDLLMLEKLSTTQRVATTPASTASSGKSFRPAFQMPPATSNDAKFSEEQLARHGLRGIDVGGGGNCTLFSLAHQMRMHPNSANYPANISQANLRGTYCDLLAKDLGWYHAFLGAEEKSMSLEEFKVAVDAFRQDRQWTSLLGDGVLEVLALHYKLNLRLVKGNWVHPFSFGGTTPFLTVVHTVSGTVDHWLSTEPLSAK